MSSSALTRLAPRITEAGAGRKASGFRPDIEGLRAIAVGVVVAFHAGVPGIPGGYVGVDAFFVLSGFLITGMLLDEATGTGRISIANFYARRIRRLLPLSTLVLIATAAASFLLMPPLSQAGVASDLRAGALYLANWHFAGQLTDYMAVGVDKSPVLHYWSLAVEEQFYVVWPLIMIVLIGRRPAVSKPLGRSVVTRRVGVAIAVIFAASLLWSVLAAQHTDPYAYYGLHTRAWELASGGALAVLRPQLPRMASAVGAVAGWLGLVLLVSSALLFDAATPFPGWAALAPVGGTVLMVLAGANGTGGGVPRLLSVPAMRYIGRISYAWYLWHWPCLVLLKALPEGAGTPPSGARTLAAVALSFLLAAVSHTLVENPVRRSRWLSVVRRRSLVLGAALTGGSVMAAVLLGVGAHGQDTAVADGSAAMTAAQARADTVRGLSGCHVSFEAVSASPPEKCVFGDREGATTVALIGDSHAQHWFPAMDRLARERGWRLLFWSKNSCGMNDAAQYLDVYDRPYPECQRWRTSLLQRLGEVDRVDRIIVARSWKYSDYLMLGDTRVKGDAAMEAWQRGAGPVLQRLSSISPDVVVLSDGPRAPADVPTCLSEHVGDPAACSFPRRGHTALDEPLSIAEHRAARRLDGIRFVDPTDILCPAGVRCPVVTGDGIIIYRDDSHMTATFSAGRADELGNLLGPVKRRSPVRQAELRHVG